MKRLLMGGAVLTTLVLLPQVALADAAVRTDGVLVFDASGDGGSTSSLVRNDNGLTVRVSAQGLTPGNAYTVWWIVLEDDFNDVMVLNASGGLAGSAGTANFAGHLSTGPIGEVDGETILFVEGDGSFDDPRGALVITVVVDHGPAIPGLIGAQISTIVGGCVENFGSPFCPDALVFENAPA